MNTDDEYDFEDVDCEDCGLKFYIRPSLYTREAQQRRREANLPERPWPTKCERCVRGLPPKYEY
jgi:ribosomal protein L34E